MPRAIPTAIQAALDSGSSRLSYCWKLTRKDGTVMGFTDHDESLTIGGTVFEPSSGLYGTERVAKKDFSVDNMEINGFLKSAAITEEDIEAGKYDSAVVEVYLVDWENPSNNYLVQKGIIGNVTRTKSTFIAEVRGLSDEMQKTKSRVYSRLCSATLGDNKCGVDISLYKTTGTILTTDSSHVFTTSDLSGFSAGVFQNGIVKFTSGQNSGLTKEIKQDITTSGVRQITLWESFPYPLEVGDSFEITAGCDKSFSVCKERFGNIENFRGFPHIPPANEVYKVALSTDEDSYDGKSLFS